MLIPLFFLSLGAIFSGYLFKDLFIGINHQSFWGKSIFFNNQVILQHFPVWLFFLIPTLIIGSIPISYFLFLKKKKNIEIFIENQKPFYNFLKNKWYFDELYDSIFVNPSKKIGNIFWKKIDIGIIDNFGPDGISKVVKNISIISSKFQSGFLYHYALVILIGLIILVTILII
jgi:NADH-quinone oxidoreductase subunit L